MKVLIAEDEGIAARKLTKLLMAEGLEVIKHCKSNAELKTYFETESEPELYFLDIHLNDGIVFEFLEECKPKSSIIFTTAYDEYAIKAFKQNSIDYLLKPIKTEELKTAIKKYKAQNQSETNLDLLQLSKLLHQKKYRERIRIKIGDKLKSIPVLEVKLIYSKEKITFIKTIENRSYPIDFSIAQIHTELEPSKFFQVNRSQIISIDHISEVISYSNSRLKVKLIDDKTEEIIVARERVQGFKQWLG